MGIDNVVRKGKVDLIDTMTFLLIPDSTRDDTGKYCLTLQSPAGEKAVFVNVKVLGKSWLTNLKKKNQILFVSLYIFGRTEV